MKMTLSTSHAADLLFRDEYGGWSYAAANAMCEYLEQLEEDLGEDIEFCPVAIRCDYSEYGSLDEAITELIGDPVDIDEEWTPENLATGDHDEDMQMHLQELTTVIPFNGGVIVQSF
ncbi:MAG: hypothetical protein CL959_04645 [Euryarchaeota archaeon]|nr:hypothetical protein [Euryarchaeota archaeon]|tara:strand:- start:1285 stop:1635 length:351 start_codon:yes stop_codon:yes gene_type:complete